jgi:hypothetical protein
MSQHTVTCDLLRNGKVILRNVRTTFEAIPYDPILLTLGKWHGEFTVPYAADRNLFSAPLTMRLRNGREGRIIVTSSAIGPSPAASLRLLKPRLYETVEYVGSGKPPVNVKRASAVGSSVAGR